MTLDKVLEIDLSNQETKVHYRPELFNGKQWIGGIGAALHLFREYGSQNSHFTATDDLIVFAIGSLSTFYPIVSKTVCVFRSPLTGDLGESYAGGRLSLAMRFADIGAIVIKGKAKKASYITINNHDVEIRPAGPLAYMYTGTIGRVLREKFPVGPGRRSSVRIGPASENGVKYGNLVVDTFRHFGRLGAGTVFGHMNLKAFVIAGDHDIPLEQESFDRRSYLRTYKKIWSQLVETELMQKYHVLGTPENVLPLNELNALPTENFQKSHFEKADKISGEKFVDTYLGRRVACNTCPVGCIHVAILRERYGEDSPADIYSIVVPYDFEPIYAVGSNLGIGNGLEVLRLIEETERLGLDTITTGVILSWLTEAKNKGIITEQDTNGINIQFGNTAAYVQVIKRIAFRSADKKDLFWFAGEGLDALVEKYGGEEFAVMINKHPPAGYSTGPYTFLGHVIGGRHSHLDNAGYGLDQKYLSKKDQIEPSVAIKELVLEEEWRNVLNSLTICLFARKIYTSDIIIEAFANLGINLTREDLEEYGRKIQKQRIQTKLDFGFSYNKTFKNLSKRFFELSTPHGQLKTEQFDSFESAYKKIMEERYNLEYV